jgi:signal recognition particle subunit SRP54
MLENLTQRLSQVVKELRGQARLTDDNIQDALREVRLALLEADVALPVVRELIATIKDKALGAEVVGSLTPGQALIGVVHRELTALMGGTAIPLSFATQPPAVILLAGLQGSGKTTTAAKLARLLKDEQKKKVLLVSADVYRPAAIEQLRLLAAQVGADFHPSTADQQPVAIAQGAVDWARKHYHDVVIVDTAGRLHTEGNLMEELAKVGRVIGKQIPGAPHETLISIDATTGQNGLRQAKIFSEAVAVDGVVLTKLDGTAKGGITLAIADELGIPVKLIGTGETLEDLSPFDPADFARALLAD